MFYNTSVFLCYNIPLAQLAERRIPNPKVVGSMPTGYASFYVGLAEWSNAMDCKSIFRVFESHSRLQFCYIFRM